MKWEDWPETKNMDKDHKDLRVVYVYMYQDVLSLNIRWVEFSILYGTSEDHIEVMNKTASHFFGTIQEGLLESIIIQISRLMECPGTGKRKNLSIRQFPKMIQNSTLKEKVEKLICSTEKVVEPCEKWRNKRYAHRDKNTVLHPETNPLPQLLQQNIREAIDAITNILDVIRSHYHGKPICTVTPPDSRGAESLLDILGKHIKTQDDTFKAKRQL